MSIVERALQKAQQQVKSSRTGADQPPSATEEPVPDGQGPVSVAEAAAEASLTSRDLKSIVQIDLQQLRTAGRIPSATKAHQTEEEIRRVKWPLLEAVIGANGVERARNNVIQVTSALAGEGKTFTALNLALSIVRDREMRVVLVDADVARPGLTPALGLEGRPGLVDALEDIGSDIGSVTYQTDVEGLFFVPAGKWHAHSPEFFAGSRMPQVIEALSRRVGRGVVILDSPPLLATNEAQVATRVAGQVLMVVRADETEQQAVLNALELVDPATRVTLVLNRVAASFLSRYYGRYYYGYGRGYREERNHRSTSSTGNRKS